MAAVVARGASCQGTHQAAFSRRRVGVDGRVGVDRWRVGVSRVRLLVVGALLRELLRRTRAGVLPAGLARRFGLVGRVATILSLGGVAILRRDLAVLEASLGRRAVAGWLLAILLVFGLAVSWLLWWILVSAIGRLALRMLAAVLLLLVRRRIALAALGRRAVPGLLGGILVIVWAAHDGDGGRWMGGQ